MVTNKDALLKSLHQNKQQFEPDQPVNQVEDEALIKGNLNFGPFVAYFKIPQSLREGLLKKGKELKPGSANDRLVGLLGDQRVYTDEDKEWFVKKFQPYMEEYVRGKAQFDGQEFDNKNHSTSFTLIDLWINYMKGGEFNPEHTHTGQLTWVAYLKVPNMLKEHEDFKGNGLGPGSIGFHYGEGTNGDWAQHTYKYLPELDGLWIFPAQLRHRVNPFYDKTQERISVSGNCYFNRPETPSQAKPPKQAMPGWQY